MKISKISFCPVVLTALLCASCSPPPAFYWGNYSQTLYQMKKTPDIEHRDKHKKELLSIIEKSNKRKLQVPPGVYCEYGYLMQQDGNTDEALKYIELEEVTYPESKTFTQRLIKSMTGTSPAAPGVDATP